MGARGPKPDPSKPNSRSKNPGNHRHGSTAYAKANMRKLEPGEPARPDWVTGLAAQMWDEFVPKLFKAELIHEIDQHILGAYCMYMAEFVAAKETLAKGLADTKKQMSESDRKSLQAEAATALNHARSIAETFGVSAKSRAAMGISTKNAGGAGASGGGEAGGKKDDGNNRKSFVLSGKR